MFNPAAADTRYDRFFGALTEAREIFHTFGNIEDANAKLDELIKLVCVLLMERSGVLESGQSKTPNGAADGFSKIRGHGEFLLDSGGSIFESEETLRIGKESSLLFSLFHKAASEIVSAAQHDGRSDLINEAFGHFIKDNFRSNTEDAQYMTPSEVTSFIVDLALHYIDSTPLLKGRALSVCDPSCGVGSFLFEFDRAAKGRGHPNPVLIGHDKARRMIRLAHVNSLTSGTQDVHLGLGNSLEDNNWLATKNGKIDLILTNPPFGARFDRDWLKSNSNISLPFYSSSNQVRTSIDSEFLFLERYLTLLSEGGIFIAVVPDAVTGSKGVAAMARQYLSAKAELLGVYHLPAVTFAQAGTRTRTSILVMKKGATKKSSFIGGEFNDLGFDVVRRKGVTIKRRSGINEMSSSLLSIYAVKPIDDIIVHSESPLIVAGHIDPRELQDWDVKQFRKTTEHTSSEYDFFSLKDIAEFASKSRKSKKYTEGSKYISILHLTGEGVWDYASIDSYTPITPGTPAFSGEVLISRINPRIPRIGIVPNIGSSIIVSTEFEIVKGKPGWTAEKLSYLLRDPFAQRQLEDFASGTSASHNRIRPEKLRGLVVRVPRDRARFERNIARYTSALFSINEGLLGLRELRAAEVTSTGV